MSTELKIVAARLHRVRMPLVHEFQTSSHRKTFLDPPDHSRAGSSAMLTICKQLTPR